MRSTLWGSVRPRHPAADKKREIRPASAGGGGAALPGPTGALAGLADRLEKLAAKLAKRQKTETMTEILREDSAQRCAAARFWGRWIGIWRRSIPR
jgi:hypothetical protein